MVDINGMQESGGEMPKNKRNGGKNITSIGKDGNSGKLNKIRFGDGGVILPTAMDLRKGAFDPSTYISPLSANTSAINVGPINVNQNLNSIHNAVNNLNQTLTRVGGNLGSLPNANSMQMPNMNYNKFALRSDHQKFELFEDYDNRRMDVKLVTSHVRNRLMDCVGGDVKMIRARTAVLIHMADLYKRDILSLNGHTPIITQMFTDDARYNSKKRTMIHDSPYQYQIARGADKAGMETSLKDDVVYVEMGLGEFDEMCEAVLLNHMGVTRDDVSDVRTVHEMIEFVTDKNKVFPKLPTEETFVEGENTGTTYQGVIFVTRTGEQQWVINHNNDVVAILNNESKQVILKTYNTSWNTNFPGLDNFDPSDYGMEYHNYLSASYYRTVKPSGVLMDHTVALNLMDRIVKDITGINRDLLLPEGELYGVYRLCTTVN